MPAAGITEASTENIRELSTPVPGVVTAIPVKIGQDVKAGDVLFKVDTRDLDAELKVRQAAVQLARVKIPEAEANLGDMTHMLELYQAVSDPRAITQEELSRRKFGVAGADSRFRQANVELASAQAQVEQTKTEIERRIIRGSRFRAGAPGEGPPGRVRAGRPAGDAAHGSGRYPAGECPH